MMTLGSLFDGSGGFPLAGTIHGIKPVWASEIEPYPLRVTAARFSHMKQLGDVTKINGAEIEPVDIITFGSPCQDLSVAGKQLGIHEGERSNLFFEAVRIIKEMREHDRAAGRATEHCRPRFAVWENVPGAFSSNKGRDFQAVLQALCEVADPDASVPFPEKGKWSKAGCIVGDGYSVAWRVYDAQYWGVPQRRKRIYLVADFASERAGEILFERESVCRNPEESGAAREGTAADAEGCAGRSGGVKCLNPWDVQSKRQYDISGAYRTLDSGNGAGGQAHGICYPSASFMGGQGAKAGGIGYSEDVSPTIKSVMSGGNTVPDVVYQNTGIGWWNEAAVAETLRTPCGGDSTKANLVVYVCNSKQQSQNIAKNQSNTLGANDYKEPQVAIYPSVARTLTAEHDSSPCVDRGQNVVALDCRNMVGNAELSGTIQSKNEGGFSLNFINPVVYSSGGFGTLSEGVGCLGTGTRTTAEMVAVYDTTQITSPANYSNPKPGDACHPLAAQQHPPLAVYLEKTGSLCANSHPGSYTGQDAFNDMLPVVPAKPPRRHIIRRLTPLECCRLQGFPDWWEDGVEGSDSARYKMWGNGIALPCAVDVLGRIARAMKVNNDGHQTD